MLLEGRNAVIYGGGGSIGSAVARAFAHEGARVHLAWRTLDALQSPADSIPAECGAAEAAGDEAPPRGYNLGGLQVAFQAQEALRRNLAAELGPHGIRAITIQTSGIVDTIPETFEGRDRIVSGIDASTLLGRGATTGDVANA